LTIVAALDAYRDARDWMEEEVFFAIYGSPAVQGMLGVNFGEQVRERPPAPPEKQTAREVRAATSGLSA
jgi:Protein of unknown function (DUF3141)